MKHAWTFVILGGVLEVFWVLFLKLSHGFTQLNYSIVTIIFLIISFYLFSKGMKFLPSGVAYTVFTGIGAVGTIIFSILFLGESVSIPKIAFSSLLIISIIGLKLTSDEDEEEEV